jgi:3-hydroxyisobutyrate dehydrogenase
MGAREPAPEARSVSGPPLTVAVLGTGVMGGPMARNIARSGLTVRAWNRTTERARALEQDGATVAERPEDAVEGADVAVTMLADADATLEVAGAMLRALGPDGVWLQAGTVGLEGTDRCVELAQREGVALVDAPVLGTLKPAQDGALTVLASGPDDAVERCEPIFRAIGKRTLRLGPAGRGTRLKLAVNTWVLALTEGAAEAVALAKGLGLGAGDIIEALDGSPTDAPYFRMKSKLMEDGEYPVSFTLRLAAKDARLIEEAARRGGVDLPLVRTISERLADGVEAGYGEEDMAATYRLSAPDGSG